MRAVTVDAISGVRLALLATLLATAAVYSGHVRAATWVYEDSNAIYANTTVIGQSPIPVNRARWLSATSHRIVWTLAGDRPAAHHGVNLALHLTNGVLVFAIAGALGLGPLAAWLTASVFLLHPIQTEAVAYAASRSELLATCCALVAFWRALTAQRWYHHVVVWAAVAAAVCAKESAAVIVPIIALTDVFRGRRLSAWRTAALLVPVALMAVSVWALDYRAQSELSPVAYAALQATALWRYLALAVVPVGQSVDHDFELVPGAVRSLALYASVATVAILGLASVTGSDETRTIWRLWDLVPGARLVAFGGAWLTIAVAPRFLMRIPETLNEHQVYLPFIGLWIAVGAVTQAWMARGAADAETV